MGSFSWLKADRIYSGKNCEWRNIFYGCPFKLLIPIEFGGGFIEDEYQDYGYLGRKDDGSPKYDMYELLAIWNKDTLDPLGKQITIRGEICELQGDIVPLKEIDEHTDHNRVLGIDIGCYDDQKDKLNYPLKLVDIEYEGTYEDCPGVSYGDPDQGFYPVDWDGRRDGEDDDDDEEEY